jgi:hypothetical protein
MADAIGQYDEMRVGVEQLSGIEELASESVAEEPAACAAGPMHDQYGIAHDALSNLFSIEVSSQSSAA